MRNTAQEKQLLQIFTKYEERALWYFSICIMNSSPSSPSENLPHHFSLFWMMGQFFSLSLTPSPIFLESQEQTETATTVPKSLRNQVRLFSSQSESSCQHRPCSCTKGGACWVTVRTQQLGWWIRDFFSSILSQLPRRKNGCPSPPVSSTVWGKAGLF